MDVDLAPPLIPCLRLEQRLGQVPACPERLVPLALSAA